MKHISVKRVIGIALIGVSILNNTLSLGGIQVDAASSDIIYPLKEVSKLECRFKAFDTLENDCKQSLPKLKTKDYEKYAKQNGGYNDFTRLYTVLWGSSYKYGWDVGNGWHMWVDIATAQWTPVYAMAKWKVINAGTLSAFGKNVSIEHTINGKKIVSNYSHLHKIHVSAGETVKVGEKIWEVGSTGNSTGNHLHFQIDLPSSFYPAYYNTSSCPYSYYQITEDGVCFDQLQNITVDPLLFLETNGAIIDKISVTKIKSTNSASLPNTRSKSSWFDMSIFNRTVYTGYSKSDIKLVQEIFSDLKEYRGPISGDYTDIEDDIIAYQLSKRVIATKNEAGAGWFGPKTRKQTKKDYDRFLKKWGKAGDYKKYNKSTTQVDSWIKTKKISRNNLISREEIEKREVEEFMKKYDVELQFQDLNSRIDVGNTSILKLTISRNGKPFVGNMPSGMTFALDTRVAKVFPTKLYNFKDGKRDIKISGIKSWETTLYVKIWNEVVEKMKINVDAAWKIIYPDASSIVSAKSIVLGDKSTGIAVFKNNDQPLVNTEYGSTFQLKASKWVQVCIKRWSLNSIKRVYKTPCSDSDFINATNFSYDDTVWGLLIFDYKVASKDAKIEIINNYNNQVLSVQNLAVKNPTWLKNTYAYKKEVIEMLEAGIVDGINKGYFLQDRELSHYDGLAWIENTLSSIQNTSDDADILSQVADDLETVKYAKSRASRFNKLSRQEFLNLVYEYTIYHDNLNVSIEYRDLEWADNAKANAIFSDNITWKDKFGDNYYQPNETVKRWEAAYMLAQALKRNATALYVSR